VEKRLIEEQMKLCHSDAYLELPTCTELTVLYTIAHLIHALSLYYSLAVLTIGSNTEMRICLGIQLGLRAQLQMVDSLSLAGPEEWNFSRKQKCIHQFKWGKVRGGFQLLRETGLWVVRRGAGGAL
jgi:hypothetical protein